MKRIFFKELYEFKSDLNRLVADKENITLLAEIQEMLLDWHYWIEKKHRVRKTRLQNLSKIKKQPQNTKETSKEIKKSIEICKFQLSELKEIKLWLRNLGNSIPHLYYDKGDLRAYSYSANSDELKELSGDIHGKDGLELELKCFRHALNSGCKALLNDLTSVMRHGDLTLMDKEVPFIMEIKLSSACSKKAEKQLQSMRAVQEYIFKDMSTTLRGGKVISKRITMTEAEKSNKSTLNEHFENSKKKGCQFSKIEDGLFCLSFFHGVDYQKHTDILMLGALSKPVFFSLNQFKNKEDNSLFYPYSLLIDDPLIYASFMTGSYSIYFFFDYGLLESAAKIFDLQFRVVPDTYIVEMWGGGVQVYSHTFIKALVEFSSINWAIKQMFSNYSVSLDMYNNMISKDRR